MPAWPGGHLSRRDLPARPRYPASPGGRLPPRRAHASVAVGPPITCLPDAGAFAGALLAMAGALRPAGRLAFDVCDLDYGEARRDDRGVGRARDDWAIVTEFSQPAPDRFVRDITTFVPNPDGSWRRDREHHENVLTDTAHNPALLRPHGVEARVAASFGSETLPPGLRVITGHKP